MPNRSKSLVALSALVLTAAIVGLRGLSKPHGSVPQNAMPEAPPSAQPVQPTLPSHARGASVAEHASPASARVPTREAATHEERVQRLRDALEARNEGDRIEGIEAAAESADPELLSILASRSLVDDPAAAPALISAVAQLGVVANSAERARAAQTLTTWLSESMERPDADAAGNVSILVEELGKVETEESTRALAEALDQDALPLHVATLAVRSLGQIGDEAGRGAVERFLARLLAAGPATGFEAELRREAEAEALSALREL